MKRLILKILLALVILNLSLVITKAQSWKELNDSVEFYKNKQDPYTALKWAKLALPQAEKEFGKDSIYAEALDQVANRSYEIGNIDSALFYGEMRLEICRKLFKDDNRGISSALNNLALFNQQKGNYQATDSLFKECIEMLRRLNIGDDRDFASTLANAAVFYQEMGNYVAAEPYYKEAFEMTKRLFKGDNPNVARIMHNLGYFYESKGNYSEAEQLTLGALEMRRRLTKGDDPELAFSINGAACFYEHTGNFAEAEPLFKEVLEMRRRLYKSDHMDLARSISNMSQFYLHKGNYAAAEPYIKEGLEMKMRLIKGDHPEIAVSIGNLAFLFSEMKKFDLAEKYYKETVNMYRRIYKGDHPSIATALCDLGTFYEYRRRRSEAGPLLKEALEMRRRMFKGDHPDLVNSLNNLGNYYGKIGKTDSSEALLKEALDITRRINKNNFSTIGLAAYNLGLLYYDKNDLAKAEPLIIEGLEATLKALANYFPSLSEKEKSKFWNTMNCIFECFNSFAMFRGRENPNILNNMYDMQLITKAQLFNSNNKIRRRILNSRDTLLIDQLKKWSEGKDYLLKLNKMTTNQLKRRGINIDSVDKAVNEMEKQLSLKSEGFKQSYEKKKVNWKLIQGLLKPDEAAVEVIRFKLFQNQFWRDTVYYAFLVVNDQTEEHPDLVLLDNGKQLENEFYKIYLSKIKSRKKDNVSYDRFWAKLGDKIRGYKKVYFSADGIYNKINPSTFLMPDGKYLQEIQDIQQVNSTKDLLLGYYQTKQESTIYNSAVLIGNPNFGLSEDKVKELSRNIMRGKDKEESYEDTARIRGIFLSQLPGTEREIKDISKFLKSKSWVVNSFLGDSAIKTVIKAANSPRVLHIATHGLFLEDIDQGGSELFGFEEEKLAENPLLRSGLFFTGADNYLNNEKSANANDEDNGLLTAYEAMNLDLDKTELVVLSACETGLGEIQNGEGVFGLRRAFQQAGAKTVMMSLWKVNDEATQLLMTSFYSNWVTGMSKRDAFANAQQAVKAKFSEPYYWGAFVMVGE